jgi:hypothetical protein
LKGVPSLLVAGGPEGGLAPELPCFTIMLQDVGSLLPGPLLPASCHIQRKINEYQFL